MLKRIALSQSLNVPLALSAGGGDSDIMLDIVSKVDTEHKVIYVWFDTGVEYQATKNHLDYLEEKYGIHIQREKAIKSIPFSCLNQTRSARGGIMLTPPYDTKPLL